ncbi:uncharacterized protein LOC128260547 [Drosophila gunungcola]|uniref:uncharacterized protein LOC128260547 n=1 Tax=Drosophila gunungcola TaxID=103775 RepID=UPI0022E31304|nr:uncharacterized protein LOC128260547 [Drosophila gunungcola]
MKKEEWPPESKLLDSASCKEYTNCGYIYIYLYPNASLKQIFGPSRSKPRGKPFVCVKEILCLIPAKIRTTTGTATERKNGKRHRRIDGPGTKINAQCIHGAHTRAGWQYNNQLLMGRILFFKLLLLPL